VVVAGKMRNNAARPAATADDEVKLDDSVGSGSQGSSKASGQQVALNDDKHEHNTPPLRVDDSSSRPPLEIPPVGTRTGSGEGDGGMRMMPEGSASPPPFKIDPDFGNKGSGSDRGMAVPIPPDSPRTDPWAYRGEGSGSGRGEPPSAGSGTMGIVMPDPPPPENPKDHNPGGVTIMVPPPPAYPASGDGSGRIEIAMPGEKSGPPPTFPARVPEGNGSGSQERPEIKPIAVPDGLNPVPPLKVDSDPLHPKPVEVPPFTIKGSGSASASTPEVGMGTAIPSTRPIGYRPGSAPQVKVYDEIRHLCNPGETIQSIAQQQYGDVRYADALLQHNRNHALASQALKSNPPDLRGAYIYVPPTSVLEEKYPGLIPGMASAPPNR
jgi:hypothetical protein